MKIKTEKCTDNIVNFNKMKIHSLLSKSEIFSKVQNIDYCKKLKTKKLPNVSAQHSQENITFKQQYTFKNKY